jgi:hypothetical protein
MDERAPAPVTQAAPAGRSIQQASAAPRVVQRTPAAAPQPPVGPELRTGDEPAFTGFWAAARDGDPDARRALWWVGGMDHGTLVPPVARPSAERPATYLAMGEQPPRRGELGDCLTGDCRRAPTGTGRAIQPPRTARKAPESRRETPPLRVLGDVNEQDTLPAVGGPHVTMPQY